MVDRCPCVAPVALRDPSEVLGHGEQKTRQGDGADDEEDEDDLAAQPSRLVWGEGGMSRRAAGGSVRVSAGAEWGATFFPAIPRLGGVHSLSLSRTVFSP